MQIDNFIWLPAIVEKIEVKHGVMHEETEEVFLNNPRLRFVESGNRKGDNVFCSGANRCRAILDRLFHL